MEEALRGHLAADAGVAELVGDHVQWSVRDSVPSVALHLITAPPDTTLKGRTGLVMARVQIDCVADGFLAAKAIGEAVVTALPGRRQVIDGVRFQGCVVIDIERDRFGAAPNILFRTRIDVRVSFSPA